MDNEEDKEETWRWELYEAKFLEMFFITIVFGLYCGKLNG